MCGVVRSRHNYNSPVPPQLGQCSKYLYDDELPLSCEPGRRILHDRVSPHTGHLCLVLVPEVRPLLQVPFSWTVSHLAQ